MYIINIKNCTIKFLIHISACITLICFTVCDIAGAYPISKNTQTNTLIQETLFTLDKEDTFLVLVSGYLSRFLVGIENDPRNQNVKRMRDFLNEELKKIRPLIPKDKRKNIPDEVDYDGFNSSVLLDLGPFKIRYFDHNILESKFLYTRDPNSPFNVVEEKVGKYLTRQILVKKRPKLLTEPQGKEKTEETPSISGDENVRTKKSAETKEEVPWYNKRVDIKLPKEDIEKEFKWIRDNAKTIERERGILNYFTERQLADWYESVTEPIQQQIDAFDIFEITIRDVNITPRKLAVYLIAYLTRTKGLGKGTIQIDIDKTTQKDIEDAFLELERDLNIPHKEFHINWISNALEKLLFGSEREALIKENPLEYSVEIFDAMYYQGTFSDANHRAASFLMNFIREKMGLPFFHPTRGNIVKYYTLFPRRRSDYKGSENEKIEFFKEDLNGDYKKASNQKPSLKPACLPKTLEFGKLWYYKVRKLDLDDKEVLDRTALRIASWTEEIPIVGFSFVMFEVIKILKLFFYVPEGIEIALLFTSAVHIAVQFVMGHIADWKNNSKEETADETTIPILVSLTRMVVLIVAYQCLPYFSLFELYIYAIVTSSALHLLYNYYAKTTRDLGFASFGFAVLGQKNDTNNSAVSKKGNEKPLPEGHTHFGAKVILSKASHGLFPKQKAQLYGTFSQEYFKRKRPHIGPTSAGSELRAMVQSKMLFVKTQGNTNIYEINPLFQNKDLPIVSAYLNFFLPSLKARPPSEEIKEKFKTFVEKYGIKIVADTINVASNRRNREPLISTILYLWPDAKIPEQAVKSIQESLSNPGQKRKLNYFNKTLSMIHPQYIKDGVLCFGNAFRALEAKEGDAIYTKGFYIVRKETYYGDTYYIVCGEKKLDPIVKNAEKIIKTKQKAEHERQDSMRGYQATHVSAFEMPENGNLTITKRPQLSELTGQSVIIENPGKGILEIWPVKEIGKRTKVWEKKLRPKTAKKKSEKIKNKADCLVLSEYFSDMMEELKKDKRKYGNALKLKKELISPSLDPAGWLIKMKELWEDGFVQDISYLSAEKLSEKFLELFPKGKRAEYDLREIKWILHEPNHDPVNDISLQKIYSDIKKTFETSPSRENELFYKQALWILREWIYRHYDGNPKMKSYDIMSDKASEIGDIVHKLAEDIEKFKKGIRTEGLTHEIILERMEKLIDRKKGIVNAYGENYAPIETLRKLDEMIEELREEALKLYDFVPLHPLDASPYWGDLNEGLKEIPKEKEILFAKGKKLGTWCGRWTGSAESSLMETEAVTETEKKSIYSPDRKVKIHLWLEIKIKNDDRVYCLDRTIGQYADREIFEELWILKNIQDHLNESFLRKYKIDSKEALFRKLQEYDANYGFYGLKEDYPFKEVVIETHKETPKVKRPESEQIIMERLRESLPRLVQGLISLSPSYEEKRNIGVFIDEKLGEGRASEVIKAVTDLRRRNDLLGELLKNVVIEQGGLGSLSGGLEDFETKRHVAKEDMIIITQDTKNPALENYEGISVITKINNEEIKDIKDSYYAIPEIVLFSLVQTGLLDYSKEALVKVYNMILNAEKLTDEEIIDKFWDDEVSMCKKTVVINLIIPEAGIITADSACCKKIADYIAKNA